jgi:hypothetical protein
MTAATGYCSYIVLAQIYYIQHHPDRHTPTPDCSTLSPRTLQFVLDQLKPLSHIVEDESVPLADSTRQLWNLLQSGSPPSLLDKSVHDLWMEDSDFLTLAKHLRLSLSLWQEPYEGPGFDIPAGTANLSYILREGKIKHPSHLDTPYLKLPSFPRSLSLGPVVIQTTNHFYICTSTTSDLLQDTQDELDVHLENFIDPSLALSTSDVLPLPEPASAALFRTVHKRSSEARRAAKKARLTPAEKREIWDDKRACDRDVGAAQREYLLSQRLAPHHSITPPLDWAPNARRTSRYDEVFQYY